MEIIKTYIVALDNTTYKASFIYQLANGKYVLSWQILEDNNLSTLHKSISKNDAEKLIENSEY